MKELERFACIAAVGALSSSAAYADDFAPPAYRGNNGSVMVAWEFDTPPASFASIPADVFAFVPTGFSDPNFYATPRIVAPVPSDWAWNMDGSISTTSPGGAWLDVVIPGYQGAWDAFARAQYTYSEFLPSIRNLEPLGFGSYYFGPIPYYVDASHLYDDWGFFQFGSSQVLHLFVDPGTSLSEIVIDTHVFPVPSAPAAAICLAGVPLLLRRRR